MTFEASLIHLRFLFFSPSRFSFFAPFRRRRASTHRPVAEVATEKAQQAVLKGVEDFDPSKLKHAETQEKVVLPDAEGWSSPVIYRLQLLLFFPEKKRWPFCFVCCNIFRASCCRHDSTAIMMLMQHSLYLHLRDVHLLT